MTVPDWLDEIVIGCLRKMREGRYRALRKFLKISGVFPAQERKRNTALLMQEACTPEDRLLFITSRDMISACSARFSG